MSRSLGWWGRKPSRPNWLGEFLIIIWFINKHLILLAAGMEAPLSLPSSPVSVRPLHLLLLLILTIAILTLLLFSYGAFPSGSILTINYVWISVNSSSCLDLCLFASHGQEKPTCPTQLEMSTALHCFNAFHAQLKNTCVFFLDSCVHHQHHKRKALFSNWWRQTSNATCATCVSVRPWRSAQALINYFFLHLSDEDLWPKYKILTATFSPRNGNHGSLVWLPDNHPAFPFSE